MSSIPAKETKLSYRPDIDGLRAIAVLGVIAFHVGIPGFSGGFVGVDIFFVISGYLITGLLAQEYERSGQIDFGAFFMRRIKRLLPALVLVVITTLIVAAFTMFPSELQRLGKSAKSVALIIANIHFKSFAGGYFDPSTDVMPLLHTWSLAVEEQYYLAWPPLFWLTHRLFNKYSTAVHRTTIGTLIFVAITSFVACLWMTSHEQRAAFYLTPYRAWEFAFGALLAHHTDKLRDLPGRIGDFMSLLGLGFILGSIALLGDQIHFPGAIALIPVLGTIAVIAGGSVHAARLPRQLMGNGPMVTIGLLSYSLYLWHWPVLAFGRDYALGSRDLSRDIGLLLLSIALAWLSYRFVERPIRQSTSGPFASRKSSYWSAFTLSVLVVASANVMMHWGERQNTEANTKLAGVQGFLETKCKQDQEGTSLAEGNHCKLGPNPNGIPSIMIWGDSHSGHLSALADEFSTRHNQTALLRQLDGCPPLLGAIPYQREKAKLNCGRYNELVANEIQSYSGMNGLKGVVLGSRWSAYLALPVTEPGGSHTIALADNGQNLPDSALRGMTVGVSPLDTQGSALALKKSLQVTLDHLTKAGLRVLIVAPFPELYFNGPQCLYRFSAEQCVVPRTRVEARRAFAINAINEVVQGRSQVRVVDPINEFCDASLCYAARNERWLYIDDNHISPIMSRHLAGHLDTDLQWAAGLN